MYLDISGVSDLPPARICPQLSQVGCRSLVPVAGRALGWWDRRGREMLLLTSNPCCGRGVQAKRRWLALVMWNGNQDQLFSDGSIKFVQEQCWLIALLSLKASLLLPYPSQGFQILCWAFFSCFYAEASIFVPRNRLPLLNTLQTRPLQLALKLRPSHFIPFLIRLLNRSTEQTLLSSGRSCGCEIFTGSK